MAREYDLEVVPDTRDDMVELKGIDDIGQDNFVVLSIHARETGTALLAAAEKLERVSRERKKRGDSKSDEHG